MRVAIVIPREWHAAAFTADPRILAAGFGEIGHEATIVCLRGSTYPGDADVITASRIALEDGEWWRAQRYDLAVVFTWLQAFQDVVASIRRGGTFVISKGDTNGVLSVRAQPRQTLSLAVHLSEDPISAARATRDWGKRLLLTKEYMRHAKPYVANLAEADATVAETDVAQANLRRFFESVGASHLVEKIHVVPNPTANAFISAAVPNCKDRLIYAAGRWDAPVKNVNLLIRVLERYLRRDQEARAIIAGRGIDCTKHAQSERIECIGHVDRDKLAEIAALARVCLVTSRSESYHLVAHEALTVGATVVGTPIPVLQSMTQGGRYGTMARSHRAESVHAALTDEMRQWDIAKRDGLMIASEWRPKLAPPAVASQLVGLMKRTSITAEPNSSAEPNSDADPPC